MGAIIVVSLIGGAVSFGLVTWAQAITGFGATIVWVLFWGGRSWLSCLCLWVACRVSTKRMKTDRSFLFRKVR
ncbi:hypothetical protein BC477_02070 [Clavibacter michiganensis subsp. michiganensis]|uniref:Uncharacterized protein n=1 Tax=Clavibacter michiganensis subsp. michiganensis TaxID=33013 RepID=A0A251XJA1_CLAMM|nr:hypothetical protein BC477_02070 [Clavibacter michiganensis subsp. michiganensis]OUE03496.1 hypothetical protein CMMCAS07_01005 [Clavibacter michiganensis subsp. michiganensis]